MHRSGTSMISRLINLCGLYLGHEEELMPSNIYNVDGYWENLLFVEINNSILSSLNGSWDTPPEQVIDLQNIPTALREKSQKLLQSFKGQEIWGWKDPRSSLTLSFWQELIPDLKVIICLRNPLEVANSLTQRDKFSKKFGLDLWTTYNQRLLSMVAPENRIITHYSTYFSNPAVELHRLLDFAGIPTNENVIQNACLATLPSLRHNQSSFEALMDQADTLEVINLYAEMCSYAGPVYWNSLADNLEEDSSHSHTSYAVERRLLLGIIEKDPMTQLLAADLSEKEKCIQSLQSQIVEKDSQISGLRQAVLEKDGQISGLSQTVAAWSQVALERERQIIALSTTLTEIYSSRSWHFVQFLRRMRSRIMG